jgi:hypothetical protein
MWIIANSVEPPSAQTIVSPCVYIIPNVRVAFINTRAAAKFPVTIRVLSDLTTTKQTIGTKERK